MAEGTGESTVFREVLRAIVSLPADSAEASGMNAKVQKLKSSLVNRFIEREVTTLAIMAGLFTNEPVVLIGPVGTAKTNLVEEMCKGVSGNYFYNQMHNFSDPDELLGPVDVKTYREEGVLARSGKFMLQEAHVAFLDEPFKASSAVRNMMLDIMLNKRVRSVQIEVRPKMDALEVAFGNNAEAVAKALKSVDAKALKEAMEDDGKYTLKTPAGEFVIKPDQFKYRYTPAQVKIPLLGLFMAANELPAETEDAAFYDRLVIRDFVNYVSKRNRPLLLLRDGGLDGETSNEHRNILTVEEVQKIQAEVRRRYDEAKRDESLVAVYDQVQSYLDEAEIAISDRTRKKIVKVAAGISVVLGDSKVTTEHLAAALYFCAPKDRDDLEKLEDIIARSKLSPTYTSAQMLARELKELFNHFAEAQKAESTPQFGEKLDALNVAHDGVRLILEDHKDDRKLAGIVEPLKMLVERVEIYTKAKGEELKKQAAAQAAAAAQAPVQVVAQVAAQAAEAQKPVLRST